jgi:hypothetical protein
VRLSPALIDAGEGAALPADGQTLSLLGRRLRTASEAASEPQSGSCVRLLLAYPAAKGGGRMLPIPSGTLSLLLHFSVKKTNMVLCVLIYEMTKEHERVNVQRVFLDK